MGMYQLKNRIWFFLLIIPVLFLYQNCGKGIEAVQDGSSGLSSELGGCSGANCGDVPVDDNTQPPVTQPPTSPPTNPPPPVPSNAILVKNKMELDQAILAAQGGETIALASGNYGAITISGKNQTQYTIIRPQAGAIPVLVSLKIQNSKKWQVSGLSFLPRVANGNNVQDAVLITGNENILENSIINYEENTSSWTANQWLQYSFTGVQVSGDYNIVRDNDIYNVAFGINASGNYNLVSRNKVNRFRADGMRGLGDYNTFEYNDVRNCIKVDNNHDDGFQSWSRGAGGPGSGVVTGVVLRGNYFKDLDEAPHALSCPTMQGIGMFDGMFKDWVIENNVIIANTWNGIAVYGADNVKIINNTVVDRDPANTPGPPWVMIHNHKNGTPSVNSVARNNIAHAFKNDSGVTFDHNLTISNPNNIFVDFNNFDLHLRAGSPAIDAGSATSAPGIDFDGNSRPRGSAVDIGAFEY